MKIFRKWMAVLTAFLMLTGCAAGAQMQTDRTQTPDEIITSAMEIYSWFTISPLDVDVELPGGEGFYRVADETLCRYDTLMGMLQEHFSPEIIDGILAYKVYTFIDGIAYGDGQGRGIDPNISDVEYEEISSDEQKTVYRATVHYLGEGENGIVPDVFEFVRERIGDKWVFTQFTFFW